MANPIQGASIVFYPGPFDAKKINEILAEQKRTGHPVIIDKPSDQVRVIFQQAKPQTAIIYGQSLLHEYKPTVPKNIVTDEDDEELAILVDEIEVDLKTLKQIEKLVSLIRISNGAQNIDLVGFTPETRGYVMGKAIKKSRLEMVLIQDKSAYITPFIKLWLEMASGSRVDMEVIVANGGGEAIDSICNGAGDFDNAFATLIDIQARIRVESLYILPSSKVKSGGIISPSVARLRRARLVLSKLGLLSHSSDKLLVEFASQYDMHEEEEEAPSVPTLGLTIEEMEVAVDHMMRQVVECSPTTVMAIPRGSVLKMPWTYQGDDGCVNYPSLREASFFREVDEIAHFYLKGIAESESKGLFDDKEYMMFPSQLHILQPEYKKTHRTSVPMFPKYMYKTGRQNIYDEGETYYTALVNLSRHDIRIIRTNKRVNMTEKGHTGDIVEPGKMYVYTRWETPEFELRSEEADGTAVTVCMNCTLLVSRPKRNKRKEAEMADKAHVFENYIHSGAQKDSHSGLRKGKYAELYHQEKNLGATLQIQRCMMMQRPLIAENFGTKGYLFLRPEGGSTFYVKAATPVFNFDYWVKNPADFETYLEDKKDVLFTSKSDEDVYENRLEKNENRAVMMYPRSLPPLELYKGLLN